MAPDSVECGDARIIRVLEAMLAELAEPLMQVGITPRLFGELAARAFVKAACKASTLRNGRINQSRVAVLTGLSRAEVRNLMRGPRGAKPRFQPRTQRVIDGWLSDPRYTARAGAPRSLPINRSAISFAALVRKYAGDVPHHAVLEELRRLKLVKEEHERVHLISPVAPTSRVFGKSLSLVLALLSDGVALSATRGMGSMRGVHRLTLKATDARESITLYERALTSATSFISGLDQSLRSAPARNSKKRGSQVTVSLLVRLKEPEAKTRRQRNVPTRD
ncbi:MAG: DUF6502 family protein [Gammaproteobacteria bacterium]